LRLSISMVRIQPLLERKWREKGKDTTRKNEHSLPFSLSQEDHYSQCRYAE
jgi:hypothetical protein